MSKHNHHEDAAQEPGVVNWDPPATRDLVERALSDGMTDPAKIIEWASDHGVALTVEEVLRLKAELQK
jgi:hypothetical protein